MSEPRHRPTEADEEDTEEMQAQEIQRLLREQGLPELDPSDVQPVPPKQDQPRRDLHAF